MLTISPASPAGTPPGADEQPVIVWDRLLSGFTDLFTRPSSGLFLTLVAGWVLCPGRRTVHAANGRSHRSAKVHS